MWNRNGKLATAILSILLVTGCVCKGYRGDYNDWSFDSIFNATYESGKENSNEME